MNTTGCKQLLKTQLHKGNLCSDLTFVFGLFNLTKLRILFIRQLTGDLR